MKVKKGQNEALYLKTLTLIRCFYKVKLNVIFMMRILNYVSQHFFNENKYKLFAELWPFEWIYNIKYNFFSINALL